MDRQIENNKIDRKIVYYFADTYYMADKECIYCEKIASPIFCTLVCMFLLENPVNRCVCLLSKLAATPP